MDDHEKWCGEHHSPLGYYELNQTKPEAVALIFCFRQPRPLQEWNRISGTMGEPTFSNSKYHRGDATTEVVKVVVISKSLCGQTATSFPHPRFP